MRLTSSAFEPNAALPARYTCEGQNESPPLRWDGVPEGTQAFALILHDPDAVSGDFVHWLMWNIPGDARELPSATVPPGAIQGANGRGEPEFMGPCPPAGTGVHRYRFILLALDAALDLEEGADRDALLAAVAGHELARAELIGLYEHGADA
jgi:Raf kinase inhibitor-like YbhB/YbcL family protein